MTNAFDPVANSTVRSPAARRDSLPKLPDMRRAVDDLLAQVPRGQVTTYGDLARALGSAAAARWVGHYLLHHDHSAACPCHRVVRAGGELGGYIAGSAAAKGQRLRADGVEVCDGKVDLRGCRFDRFNGKRPLERLRRYQESLPERLSLRGTRREPEVVGGVDVSYESPTLGVAAYALVGVASGELLWSTTVRRRITFPVSAHQDHLL